MAGNLIRYDVDERGVASIVLDDPATRNALGDALYEWGRTGEARSAYEKALAVNAADVRARYNLAWVHVREREYPQALLRIAEALALDKTGEYRERLLQKQQEVVALQTR